MEITLSFDESKKSSKVRKTVFKLRCDMSTFLNFSFFGESSLRNKLSKINNFIAGRDFDGFYIINTVFKVKICLPQIFTQYVAETFLLHEFYSNKPKMQASK